MEFVRRSRRASLWLAVGIGLCSLGACKKKAPPDLHLVEGYRLLQTDARKALEEFAQVRNKADLVFLLGQGLAYEGVREYAKAEETLESARKIGNEPGILLPLARVRLMLGKSDEARRDIDAVTAKVGSDLPALLLEACLANDKKRAQGALAHLDAWPAQRPKQEAEGGILAEYHLARAVLLYQLGDSENGKKAEDAAKAVGMTSDSFALALASLAYRAERHDLAVRLLERLVDKSFDKAILRQTAVLTHALGAHALTAKVLANLPRSSDEDAYFLQLRAEHDFATMQPDAVASVRRAMAATKDVAASTQLQHMLAEALIRADQMSEARGVLEELLKKQPKNEGAQLGLARLDLLAGKTDAALARLKPLADGGLLAAHELLAWAELQAKHYDQARSHFQEVIRQAPGDSRALTALVGLELRQKRRKVAIDLIEEQIKRSPKDPSLWLLMAKALRETEGTAPAEATLRRGVTALPNEPGLWIALAGEQRRRDNQAEVLATLKQAESHNPNAVSIAAAIATIYTQMGKPEQALAYYEKVLRFAEGDVGALNNTAMLYADDLHAPEKAVVLAEQAHKLAPSHPAVTDTLGWALYRRGGKGDLARAKELLESIQDKLTSPTAKYHLGMVLIGSGAAKVGKQLLRNALAMTEEFPEAAAAQKALSTAP